MLKRFIPILMAALALLTAAPAQAWIHGVPAANPPVLQAVSVPFGAQTRSGRGSVRLSSLDTTTVANQPQTFSGIDLWVSGNPCATWTETWVSGRNIVDLTLIAADTPEGTGAITPTFTSTGSNNATGSYVVSISCKDAGGNLSNTVNLTYVTTAHTVNIGTGDRVDFGVTPSGFGNTSGGKVWLSVGADFHGATGNQCCSGIRWDNGAYANQVVITNADNARPPYLFTFFFSGGSGMANYQVQDLTVSGQLAASQTVVGFSTALGAGTDNITWVRIHGFFSYQYVLGTWGSGNSGTAWAAYGCDITATHCGLADSDFDFVGTAWNPGSGSYVHNTTFRHFYNNALFFTSSSQYDDIEDVNLFSPMISVGGVHVDNCQIADGATPNHITIKRLIVAQADGDTQAQGCPFRGSSSQANCYVDDGTGAHGPGVVMTCSSGLQSGANGSIIVIPGVLDYTNNVTVICPTVGVSPSNCGGQLVLTLANLSPTNIGSPGSPVTVYSAGGMLDWTMDGIIVAQAEPNGFGTNGEAGTSVLQDFALFQMNTTPGVTATYTGSISSSGVLTVATQPVGNYPGEVPCMVDCGRVYYASSGCSATLYCNMFIQNQLSGTTEGIGTYQLNGYLNGNNPASSQTIINGPNAWADNTVGGLNQNFCAVSQLHIGIYNIKNGYAQAGGGPCASVPANTTVTNFLNAGGGASMPASAYASGLTSQQYLQAITWSSRVSSAPILTNAQIISFACRSVKPKIGGGLDQGGGLWTGPVTGETNAGTHTGGGNWVQAGVDSGIQCPGGSLAP